MTDEKKITISVSKAEYEKIELALKARALHWRSPDKHTTYANALNIAHTYEALAKKIEEQVKGEEE